MVIHQGYFTKKMRYISTKTMGHKMTSFFTGIKKEQSKGSIFSVYF